MKLINGFENFMSNKSILKCYKNNFILKLYKYYKWLKYHWIKWFEIDRIFTSIFGFINKSWTISVFIFSTAVCNAVLWK